MEKKLLKEFQSPFFEKVNLHGASIAALITFIVTGIIVVVWSYFSQLPDLINIHGMPIMMHDIHDNAKIVVPGIWSLLIFPWIIFQAGITYLATRVKAVY